MPRRREHPSLRAKKEPSRVAWPEGAPSRPVKVHQLFNEGVYAEVQAKIREVLRSVALAIEKGGTQVAPAVKCKIFQAAATQPAWARECIWDAADPEDCVPLQSFKKGDPPGQQANVAFFLEWAERLGWQDADMLQQVTTTGVNSGSACSRDTVIFGHHLGLRAHVAAPCVDGTGEGSS